MFALESRARQCCHSPLLFNTACILSQGSKAREKKEKKKDKYTVLSYIYRL